MNDRESKRKRGRRKQRLDLSWAGVLSFALQWVLTNTKMGCGLSWVRDITSGMSPLEKRLIYYTNKWSEREIEVVIRAIQNISALLPATGLDCPSLSILKLGQWNVSRPGVHHCQQNLWEPVCNLPCYLFPALMIFLLGKIKFGNLMLAPLLLIKIWLNYETILFVWSSDLKTTEGLTYV